MDKRDIGWSRPIETAVVAVTMLGGGLSAAGWLIFFSVIPAFVAKASHPQYADPNSYLWGYLALATIAGIFAGLADALIFRFLRRTVLLFGDRLWVQWIAALITSALTTCLAYWIFLRGDPHTNPLVFVLVFSTISFIGFIAWIFLIHRSGHVANHRSADAPGLLG